MKKILATLLCTGMIFCTGSAAYALNIETSPNEVQTTETMEAEDAVAKFWEIILSNLTDEQIEHAEDVIVDLLTNEDIMNDATFLLDTITEEQQDVLVRLVFNIIDVISGDK